MVVKEAGESFKVNQYILFAVGGRGKEVATVTLNANHFL
jgi:hypothetical protein